MRNLVMKTLSGDIAITPMQTHWCVVGEHKSGVTNVLKQIAVELCRNGALVFMCNANGCFDDLHKSDSITLFRCVDECVAAANAVYARPDTTSDYVSLYIVIDDIDYVIEHNLLLLDGLHFLLNNGLCVNICCILGKHYGTIDESNYHKITMKCGSRIYLSATEETAICEVSGKFYRTLNVHIPSIDLIRRLSE
ncbi:MAG: hypothetical protein NC548_11160 [Lachnospiraceae bacterium]|nr:hypothetical protein [Lachnospiraceae bacterium]